MISRRTKQMYRQASTLRPGMEVRRKDGQWSYIVSSEVDVKKVNVKFVLVDGNEYEVSYTDLVMSR